MKLLIDKTAVVTYDGWKGGEYQKDIDGMAFVYSGIPKVELSPVEVWAIVGDWIASKGVKV